MSSCDNTYLKLSFFKCLVSKNICGLKNQINWLKQCEKDNINYVQSFDRTLHNLDKYF